MVEFGKIQTLSVVKKTEFGVYLGTEDDRVLLPGNQIPGGDAGPGDEIQVYVYKDTKGRLIATTKMPYISLGEVRRLTVKEVTPIGAFADWGLDKDLLIPFREQTCTVKEGKSYLVALYIDKSGRLCGTMRVYNYMQIPSSVYAKGDMVSASVYEIKELGAFVAVEDKYFGLIPRQEFHSGIKVGDEINVRVINVRSDGKLDVSPTKLAYIQMNDDADKIVSIIASHGGTVPYTDKSITPEMADREYSMSKSAFKRAIGRLYKEHIINIEEDRILLTEKGMEKHENNN